MARAKADKIEVARREAAVYRQLLDGWTATQIVENCRAEYGIAAAMAYRYLGRAWKQIADEAAPERSEHHGRAVAAGYAMLRECESVKEKLAVWHTLAKLLGLYAAKSIDLSPPNTVIRLEWVDQGPTDYRKHIPPPTPEMDYSALTDEQLEQLEAGREAAAVPRGYVDAAHTRALFERLEKAERAALAADTRPGPEDDPPADDEADADADYYPMPRGY